MVGSPFAHPHLKSFPSGRRGVLIPAHDRRAAALGICMYTVSRPSRLRIQRAAYHLTRVVGVRCIPGRLEPWTPQLQPEQWATLLDEWRLALGTFDAFAVYQRRQEERTGLTVLLVQDGNPLAVLKVRDDYDALNTEQSALASVQVADVCTFRAPEPLGIAHCAGGLAWSAQSAVFTAPHRPVLTAPDGLFDEVRRALVPVVGTSSGQCAAHNDVTPWNLRMDRDGTIWLFDWEDAGLAPAGSDRTYFCAASYSLRPRAMPSDLPIECLDYWRRVIRARPAGARSDAHLAAGMLHALDISQSQREGQYVS